jgi:hypothetical protein
MYNIYICIYIYIIYLCVRMTDMTVCIYVPIILYNNIIWQPRTTCNIYFPSSQLNTAVIPGEGDIDFAEEFMAASRASSRTSGHPPRAALIHDVSRPVVGLKIRDVTSQRLGFQHISTMKRGDLSKWSMNMRLSKVCIYMSGNFTRKADDHPIGMGVVFVQRENDH